MQTGDPNTAKPGNGFSRNGEIVAKTKIAIDDFSASPISHIAEKLEGSLYVRSAVRSGSAVLGSVQTAFLRLNPNTARP